MNRARKQVARLTVTQVPTADPRYDEAGHLLTRVVHAGNCTAR